MKPKDIKGILVYFIFPTSLGQFPLWPIGIERYLDRFQVNRNRFIGSESDYRLLRLPQPPVYFFKLVYFLKITQGPTRFFNGNFSEPVKKYSADFLVNGGDPPFPLREGVKKSKWKFKMAFAMKGGGSRGGLVCH